MFTRLKAFCVCSILGFLSLSSATAALPGHELGNGGDANELEFGMYAYAMYEILSENPALLPQVSRPEYRSRLMTASYSVTEEILYDRGAKRRMALNFPERNAIRFNLADWRGLETRPELKIALALHELLGLLGVEVAEYDLSIQVRPYLDRALSTAKNILPFRLAGLAEPVLLVRSSAKLCQAGAAQNVQQGALARAYTLVHRQARILLPKGSKIELAAGGPCADRANAFASPGDISEFFLLGEDGKTWVAQRPESKVRLEFHAENGALRQVSVSNGEVFHGNAMTLPVKVCGAIGTQSRELEFGSNGKIVAAWFRGDAGYPRVDCPYFRGSVQRAKFDPVTGSPVSLTVPSFFDHDPRIVPAEVRIVKDGKWLKIGVIYETSEFYPDGKPKILHFADDLVQFPLKGKLYEFRHATFDSAGLITPGTIYDHTQLWGIPMPRYNGLRLLFPLDGGGKPDHAAAWKIADSVCRESGFDAIFLNFYAQSHDVVGSEDFYDPVAKKLVRVAEATTQVFSERIACQGLSTKVDPLSVVYR